MERAKEDRGSESSLPKTPLRPSTHWRRCELTIKDNVCGFVFHRSPAKISIPFWRADEVAARDGGSSRDEIYGFQPIPRANGRASMRFYSAASYRGHLSAGICFCLSVGGCVKPQEGEGEGGGGGPP